MLSHQLAKILIFFYRVRILSPNRSDTFKKNSFSVFFELFSLKNTKNRKIRYSQCWFIVSLFSFLFFFFFFECVRSLIFCMSVRRGHILLITFDLLCIYNVVQSCLFDLVSVGWGCRIHRQHLCRGISPHTECPGYDAKPSQPSQLRR